LLAVPADYDVMWRVCWGVNSRGFRTLDSHQSRLYQVHDNRLQNQFKA